MRLARFAWIVLAWIVVVVLWGAVVRATGSGAGCGAHWPLCNVEVLPRAPGVATLIEWSHRATSGLALVAVVALAVAVFRSRPRGDDDELGAVLSVLFILSEAAVGAGLVLFRLVADDDSTARAMAMVVHLANTFLLLGALALTAHWAGGGRPLRLRGRGASLAWVLLALGGSWRWARAARSRRSATRSSPPNRSPTAWRRTSPRPRTCCCGCVCCIRRSPSASRPCCCSSPTGCRTAPRSPSRAQRWATAAIALTLLQLVAGVVNVALLAPVWMQVLHLLLADLLWLAAVLLAAEVLAEPSTTPGG